MLPAFLCCSFRRNEACKPSVNYKFMKTIHVLAELAAKRIILSIAAKGGVLSDLPGNPVPPHGGAFILHPEMALYIPLIGGTGGNVGTQSSALVVQGLANSSLDANNTWKQILKESVRLCAMKKERRTRVYTILILALLQWKRTLKRLMYRLTKKAESLICYTVLIWAAQNLKTI